MNIINNRNKTNVEMLIETIRELDYGTIIEHKIIEKIINETYQTQKYYSIISKANETLLKEGKKISCVNKIGYKVIEADEYSDEALDVFKQSFNRMKKANNILLYAPVEKMSNEGKIRHNNILDKSLILYESMRKTSIELKKISRKKPHPLTVANRMKNR